MKNEFEELANNTILFKEVSEISDDLIRMVLIKE
jgi:hypothetical protein